MHNTTAQAIANALRQARRIVIFTGAGMSAESGIATFRGQASSHWQQFKPEELASPDGWRANKQRVWAWYEGRNNISKKWTMPLRLESRINPVYHSVRRQDARVLIAAPFTQNAVHPPLRRDRALEDGAGLAQKKVRDQPAMIRHAWIGAHADVTQKRQCVLAGESRTTVYFKRKPVVFVESDEVLKRLIGQASGSGFPTAATAHPARP